MNKLFQHLAVKSFLTEPPVLGTEPQWPHGRCQEGNLSREAGREDAGGTRGQPAEKGLALRQSLGRVTEGLLETGLSGTQLQASAWLSAMLRCTWAGLKMAFLVADVRD